MPKALVNRQVAQAIEALLREGVLWKVLNEPEKEWGLRGELLQAARLLYAHPRWLRWIELTLRSKPSRDLRKVLALWRRLESAMCRFELQMSCAVERRMRRGEWEREMYGRQFEDWESWVQEARGLISSLLIADRLERWLGLGHSFRRRLSWLHREYLRVSLPWYWWNGGPRTEPVGWLDPARWFAGT